MRATEHDTGDPGRRQGERWPPAPTADGWGDDRRDAWPPDDRPGWPGLHPPAWAGGAPRGGPDERDVAGIGRRLVAVLVDGLILSALTVPMLVPVVLDLRGPTPQLPPPPLLFGLSGAVLAVQVVYEVVGIGRYGATPGKRLLGVTVTTADKAMPIGLGRALGRWAARVFLSSVLLIGYAIALFDRRNRSLHDIVAATLVLRHGSAGVERVASGSQRRGLALLAVGCLLVVAGAAGAGAALDATVGGVEVTDGAGVPIEDGRPAGDDAPFGVEPGTADGTPAAEGQDPATGQDPALGSLDATDVPVGELVAGDCLVLPTRGESPMAAVTDCADPHEAEVFVVHEFPDDAFEGDAPTDVRLDRRSDAACVNRFEEMFGPPVDETSFGVLVVPPTEGTWREGDREAVCIVVPGGLYTGSVVDELTP